MQGHSITIYPDASGQNTSSKSESVRSDHPAQAGFQILAKSANPPVKDRVNSVNALILNDQGKRRLMVNTDQCPTFTESLEQQPYDKNANRQANEHHERCRWLLHGGAGQQNQSQPRRDAAHEPR
jgi:hypothetical protein